MGGLQGIRPHIYHTIHPYIRKPLVLKGLKHVQVATSVIKCFNISTERVKSSLDILGLKALLQG